MLHITKLEQQGLHPRFWSNVKSNRSFKTTIDGIALDLRMLTFKDGSQLVIRADPSWGGTNRDRVLNLYRQQVRPENPNGYAFTTSGSNPGLQIMPSPDDALEGTIVLTYPDEALVVMLDGPSPADQEWKIPLYVMVDGPDYESVRHDLDVFGGELLDALKVVFLDHGVKIRSVGLEDRVYDEATDVDVD